MHKVTSLLYVLLVFCLLAGAVAGCSSQDANEVSETEESAPAPLENSDAVADEFKMKNLPPQPLSADGEKLKRILIDWTNQVFAIVDKVKNADDGDVAGRKIGESVDKLVAELKAADITITTQLLVDVQGDPEFKAIDTKMGKRMDDLKNNFPEVHEKMGQETLQHMMRLSSEIEQLIQETTMQKAPDAGQQ